MSIYKGNKLSLEIFGASHAPSIGVTVSGMPAGLEIDMEQLQAFLKRRAPGLNAWSTARREADIPEFTEGLDGNKLTGEPWTAVIYNKDTRSRDYSSFKRFPRPGHADYTGLTKYGPEWDNAGGGAFSGRMTAPLCIAGGVCKQILESQGITVSARVVEIARVRDEAEKMKQAIADARAAGDSVGGIIECVIDGLPAGIGGPLFDGLEGQIAKLVFAIPAAKGIEFGAGFEAARMMGSENNDAFGIEDGKVITLTNNAGGILGGITTGMPVTFRVAFKPTPSIAQKQQTVDLEKMEEAELEIHGRHDPCVVPRAVPCVEAAAAIAIVDMM